MSLTSDPLWLILFLTIGGGLLILAGGWNLIRGPRPRGAIWLPRLLFSVFTIAVGGGAIWTGLYHVSAGDPGFPESIPKLSDARLPDTVAPRENTGDLVFHRDVAAAWPLAREAGQPLVIDFFAEWCDPCHKWNQLAAEDSGLNAALKTATLARVHDTDPAFDVFQEHPIHEGLRIGLPYFVIIDSSGKIQYQSNDYRDTRGMIRVLKELAAQPSRIQTQIKARQTREKTQ